MPGAAGFHGGPEKGVGRGGGGPGLTRSRPSFHSHWPSICSVHFHLLAPSHRPPPGRHLKCAEQVPRVEQQLCAGPG